MHKQSFLIGFIIGALLVAAVGGLFQVYLSQPNKTSNSPVRDNPKGMSIYAPPDIAELTKAIEIRPDDDELYFRRGDEYLKNHDYDKAILDYNKCVELNPNSWRAYNQLGYAYTVLHDYKNALYNLTQAINLDTTKSLPYINRAHAYKGAGNYDMAIQDYNKAIQLNPNDPDAYNGRGMVYIMLKDYAVAISSFEKSIQLDSDIILSLRLKTWSGVKYSFPSKFFEALSSLKPVVTIILGWCLYAKYQYERGI